MKNEIIQTPPPPAIDSRVIDSLVTRGDISALSHADRAVYYVNMCKALGLTASSQPFAILKLNGKEILYPTRGATDQLAAIHRLNREIIDGPKEVTIAGTKMIYAMCRATHPNGRIETAVATVPCIDLLNALMKAETKAKRRATLSILGLGMLDETEIDAIPAHAKQPTEQVVIDDAEVVQPPVAMTSDFLAEFTKDVDALELPAEAVAIWIKHRGALSNVPAEHKEAAWKTICARVEVLGKMNNARVWLKRAIATEDARRSDQDLEALATEIRNAKSEQEINDALAEMTDAQRESLSALALGCIAMLNNGPKDDGPKGSKRKPPVKSADATGSANEVAPDLSNPATALAVLRSCKAPQHAVAHYAKHHAHKPLNQREVLRNALVSMLWQRWPGAVPTRDDAERMVADSEATSAVRVAA